jgi:hypothetical protein
MQIPVFVGKKRHGVFGEQKRHSVFFLRFEDTPLVGLGFCIMREWSFFVVAYYLYSDLFLSNSCSRWSTSSLINMRWKCCYYQLMIDGLILNSYDYTHLRAFNAV